MGPNRSTPTPAAAAAQATVDSVVSTNKTQSNAAVKHNEEERPHNFGQPIRPPHKKVAGEIEQKTEKSGASKLKTDCRVQQRASLRCIEENYENKDHRIILDNLGGRGFLPANERGFDDIRSLALTMGLISGRE